MATAPAALLRDADARTRVLRSAPEEPAPWELWERRPPPPLEGLVAGIWAGVSPEANARHRVLPNGELLLMLHLGPTQRLAERDGAPSDELLGGAFVAGLQERPATYACTAPRTRVAAVRLLPLGGWTLFGGLPQAELRARVLDLEAVLGSRAGTRALRDRMAEAPELGTSLDALEAWLLERLDGAAAPAHAATREALSGLLRSGGALRVEALAERTGLSARRLHELFRREIGLPAKRLARLLRFRRALEGLATAPRVELARLAQDCGYYDQAHLYREFRALATMTPHAYRLANGDGLDGPYVIEG